MCPSVAVCRTIPDERRSPAVARDHARALVGIQHAEGGRQHIRSRCVAGNHRDRTVPRQAAPVRGSRCASSERRRSRPTARRRRTWRRRIAHHASGCRAPPAIVRRACQRHLPTRAPGRRARRRQGRRPRRQSARDSPARGHLLERLVGGISLGDAAGVEPHARRARTDGPARRVERHSAVSRSRARGREVAGGGSSTCRRARRHSLRQRADRDVEGAAALARPGAASRISTLNRSALTGAGCAHRFARDAAGLA